MGPAAASTPARVLVVDDESILRAFMVRALRADGGGPGLVSGHPEELHRARGLDALVRATLAKPFTMDELKRLVAGLV